MYKFLLKIGSIGLFYAFNKIYFSILRMATSFLLSILGIEATRRQTIILMVISFILSIISCVKVYTMYINL